MQDDNTTDTPNAPNIPTPPSPIEIPLPPTKSRKKLINKIALSVAITLITLVVLPFVLLAGGVLYLIGPYSADPFVNIDDEKAHIREHLRTKYGKDFTVTKIETKARKYLGDSQDISAEAHLDDDKNTKISLHKTLGFDVNYHDNYLAHVWGIEARALLAQKINDLYDVPPKLETSVSPTPGFNSEYRLGRVMSLDEAVKEAPSKINYQMKIVAGADGTPEEHSSKLYGVKEYMSSMYKGASSHIWYDFTRDNEGYRCFLPGFRLQFIESDRQLHGCWYPTSNNVKPTYTPSEPIKEVEGEALPITIRPGGATITKLPSSGSSSKSLAVNHEGLSARLDIHKGGFGDRINDAKQQFVESRTNNLPIENGMTAIALQPDQHVMVGAIRYRRDMSADKRIIHYVLAYKTFLVHIYATTYDEATSLDARDQEFWLYNFAGSIKPVDGFKETN